MSRELGAIHMFYYRFRSAGELALKELLYDELYLASSAECNDPHDGMAFLAFGGEHDKWQRLIDFAWDGVNLPSMGELVSDLLTQILADCPLTYADAIEYNYEDVIKRSSSAPESSIANVLAQRLRSLLTLYKPQAPYFASFSLSQNNPLMWSHYASMHQGHCLIFRDIDGYLEQCPRRRKNSIHRQTNGGLAPRMSLGIAEKLAFQTIKYQEDTELRDAFERFPEKINGKGLSELEGQQLRDAHRHEVLTKNAAWSYEREVRVTVDFGASWLFGEPLEFTPLERLFHFRPTQLVGIIMGARMPLHQQSRIREICKARLDQIATDLGKHGVEDPLWDFMIFKADILRDRRDIGINPVELPSPSQQCDPESNGFENRLERWQQGYALVFSGSAAEWQQFE